VEPASEPLWYFAYGSNLSQATFTGRRGIRPLQKRWGWLEGYRLCFDIPIGPGERGVANICSEADACTFGAVYLITPADAEHLDRTEGVDRGFYRRVPVTVCTQDGDRINAFAYQSAFRREERKPSLRYVGLLLEGAREHGLPDDYVRYLESFELAVDERRPAQEGSMVERRRIRFYFAYNSPYAFLASQRLERELAPFAPEVEYKPVYSPRTGGPPDVNSPRLKYLLEDVRRFADAYGLQLNPGPMVDTRKACIGFLFASAHGRGRGYHDRVYRARFLEGKDIAQEETLAAIAEQCGLDRQAFLAGLADERYAAALDGSNRDAQADDVFGFPFFIYEGKKFWGNDRLEWLARELAKT
jgi:2-hydroxychromene-2-carboxylate isomerase/cation transport regulator ChaC